MKKAIVVGFLVALLSGCASIVSKTSYDVAIGSTPGGSAFVVKDKSGIEVFSGVTPSSVNLKASSGFFAGEKYTIHFTKEGYPDKTIELKSTIDGWYAGNIIFGGIIGLLIVDPASGAMYRLPSSVDVTLDGPVSVEGTKSDLTIASIESLTDYERQQLVKIN